MNLQDKKNDANNRLNQIKQAIKSTQEKMLWADEPQEMKQSFKQNLALSALNELPKWDRLKAYRELEDTETRRTLDMMAIDALETMERAAIESARDANAELEAATRKFNFLSEKVAAILESGQFDEIELSAPDSRQGVHCDAARLNNFKTMFRELQSLSDDLCRDITKITKRAGPILAM